MAVIFRINRHFSRCNLRFTVFKLKKRIPQVNVLDGFVHMLQLHSPWKSHYNVSLGNNRFSDE